MQSFKFKFIQMVKIENYINTTVIMITINNNNLILYNNNILLH